jgi:hypothetical protein
MALTVVGIPGLIVVAHVAPIGIARLVGRCVLVAAVLTDLTSVYFDVTYLIRGGGFHQVAFYALAYYVVFVIFGMSAAWWWQLVALGVLTAFHIACQWYLPRPIARKLGWRAEPLRQSADTTEQ